MSIDPNKENLKVGVIGAGAMGRGIAQVSVTGGMTAVIFDTADGAATTACDFISGMIDRSVDKGRLSDDAGATAKANLIAAAKIEDLADCDVIVEAIVENLEIKQKVFQQIEAIVSPDTLITSNTSSIRISSIAAACKHKGRIAGLHFFNPVPLMKLVEVIKATDTTTETANALSVIGKRMGRVPVIVKDAPGFLVNLGGRAYTTEAMRLASEGVAEPHEIDAIMRDACGFRMGPFELADLTGIDVNFPVSQIIYNGYFQDKRLATSPIHESMLAAGRLGRKTKAGFYNYDEQGQIIYPPEPAKIKTKPAQSAYIPEAISGLDPIARDIGLGLLKSDDGTSPILIAPLGEDCTSVIARLGLDSKRVVAVDMLSGVYQHTTIMAAPGADDEIVFSIMAAFRKISNKVTRIKDSPGFVAQRLQAMIANLGSEMAQIGIATPEDIDKGMKLGLNYPHGSVEMAEHLGVSNTLEILEQIQLITGEERYRPSQWLRRRALLGLPIHTPN